MRVCLSLTPTVLLLLSGNNATVGVLQTWLSGGYFAEHVQQQTLGDFGSLAELQGRHVLTRRREGKMGAQTYELPGSLSHLRLEGQKLQGASDQDGRVWYHPSKRSQWCIDRLDESQEVRTG